MEVVQACESAFDFLSRQKSLKNLKNLQTHDQPLLIRTWHGHDIDPCCCGFKPWCLQTEGITLHAPTLALGARVENAGAVSAAAAAFSSLLTREARWVGFGASVGFEMSVPTC